MAWPNHQGSPSLVEPVIPNRSKLSGAIPGRHMDRARPPVLDLGISIPSWQDQADCRNRPDLDALFFPPKGPVSKKAKEMCAACPVNPDCLEYALRTRSVGVWAGTNDEQRRQINARSSASPFCFRGHDQSFHGYIQPNGRKRCRTCHNLRAVERRREGSA